MPSDCCTSSWGYSNIVLKNELICLSNWACLMISQGRMWSSYLTISKVKAAERVCFGGLWHLIVWPVCLNLIWVLNPWTGSDIWNKLPFSGSHSTVPVWRRTAVLKINREDSLWVRGDVQNNMRQNVDEISAAVMWRMTLMCTMHLHFI